MELFIDNEKIKEMKNAILNSKEKSFYENPFYWLAQLDYKKPNAYPEYEVLNKNIFEDFKKIEEAIVIINSYRKIGVSFENEKTKNR